MNNDRRSLLINLGLVLSLLLGAISVVYGNSGPPTIRPSDQKLIFDEESGIALQEEWVKIVMESEEEGMVEVRYLMENISREEENLEMLFILPEQSASLEIFWNNQRISTEEEVPSVRLPRNWRSSEIPVVRDPLSGMNLRGEYYDYGWHGYKGELFSVNLPLGETGELVLHYPSYSGFYRHSEVINPIYHQIYYLTPALFWEGEAKVNLEFHLPEGNYALNSNIPMENNGEGIYQSTLEELPEEEWFIGFVSTSGLIFHTNARTYHNIFVVIIMILMILGIGFLSKKKDPRFKWLSVLVIPPVFLFRVGYGGFLLLVFVGPLLLLILSVWLFTFLYHRFVKKSVG